MSEKKRLDARIATPDDIEMLMALRRRVAGHLHATQGVDQWHNEERGRAQMMRLIERDTLRYVHLGSDAVRDPIGTYALSVHADQDFWIDEEQRSARAMYLYKLMIDPGYAGTRLGDALLGQAAVTAQDCYADTLRIDCWRSNTKLHRWFVDRGFRCVADRPVAGRESGMLFEADPEKVARATQGHPYSLLDPWEQFGNWHLLPKFDRPDRRWSPWTQACPVPGDRYDTAESVIFQRAADIVRNFSNQAGELSAEDALAQAARMLETHSGEARRLAGVANRAYNGDL